MKNITEEKLFGLEGTQMVLRDFYRMNGFAFEEIDYDKPVDMETLSKLKPE